VIGCKSFLQAKWTALMHSALCGHVECVQLLIQAGAEKEAFGDVRFVCSICGRFLFAFVL
jgi:hypothetical protein